MPWTLQHVLNNERVTHLYGDVLWGPLGADDRKDLPDGGLTIPLLRDGQVQNGHCGSHSSSVVS